MYALYLGKLSDKVIVEQKLEWERELDYDMD